jgi:hypothetical protein
MNRQNQLNVVGLALAMLCGCQGGGGAGKTPSTNTATNNSGSRPTNAPPPPPVTYSLCSDQLPKVGQWKGDPVLFDVNGDGHLDLAANPRLGNGPHIWLGNGRGEWNNSYAGWSHHENSCGGGVTFLDVNQDGKLDMTLADHCRGVFIFQGDGSGEKWEIVVQNLYPKDIVSRDLESQTFLGAEDMDSGDVNGDGFADLIVSASDESGISLYLGDGTGRNWKRSPGNLPTKAWANRVTLIDMNEDGFADVLTSHADGPRVFLNNGKGEWTDASSGLPSPVIRGLYTGITAADVNEDGRPDIVTANWVDGPEVYVQQTDGSWKKALDVFPDMLGGAIGIAAGDLDRDGHVDIVVSGQMRNEPGLVRGVFALRGNGKGEFAQMRNCGLPETGLMTTMGITLGDVNSDGLLDVVAGSGMPVERVPSGPSSPVIAPHLIVWCSQAKTKEASLTASRD